MQLLKINEAALRLQVTPGTVRQWIRLGRLGHTRLGRSVRVSEQELVRLVNQGTSPSSRA